MYLVIGNCPRKTELKDLNDSIYYKQQKIYSDAQYNASNDLKDAERKGLITVLQRTPEKGGSAELSSFVAVSNKVENPPSSFSNKQVEELFERIRALEGGIQLLSPQQQKSTSSEAIDQLTDKISKLEQNLQGGNTAPLMAMFFEAFKRLEDKIGSTQQNDEVLRRLTCIINQSSAVPAAAVAKEAKEDVRPEEIYVPTITVEDANTHVKLNVRTLESGSDNVGDALKALKNLKSKS